MNYLKRAALVGMLAGFCVSGAQADIAVIANLDNLNPALSLPEAKRIFLGKQQRFANGDPIVVIDQSEQSVIRDVFYQQVAHKSAVQLKSYWTKLVFSGKGTPPDALEDDNAVKAWVAQNLNGLGYIDAQSVDSSVKVLLTVKE